jgi:hypothetical protein
MPAEQHMYIKVRNLLSTTPWRRMGEQLHHFWPRQQMGEVSLRPNRFTSGEKGGTHSTGAWVRPRAGLDEMKKWN